MDMPQNDQELQQELYAYGQRLGQLLLAANLPEEVKQALVDLVPRMDPEQLDKLMDILEHAAAQALTHEMADFITQIQSIQQEYEADIAAADAKANAELDEIEKMIKE